MSMYRFRMLLRTFAVYLWYISLFQRTTVWKKLAQKT